MPQSLSQVIFQIVFSDIDHQEQHHRTQTFQEGYRQLLRKYQVPFDERYVWD